MTVVAYSDIFKAPSEIYFPGFILGIPNQPNLSWSFKNLV